MEFDAGFGNIIVVDNLPVVPREKFEKLEGVIRKIYSQIGVIKEDGLWMPVESDTQKTLGYCFIEYNTPQVLAFHWSLLLGQLVLPFLLIFLPFFMLFMKLGRWMVFKWLKLLFMYAFTKVRHETGSIMILLLIFELRVVSLMYIAGPFRAS